MSHYLDQIINLFFRKLKTILNVNFGNVAAYQRERNSHFPVPNLIALRNL